MTDIFSNNAATKHAVSDLIDCNSVDGIILAITDAAGIVTATWASEIEITMDGQLRTIPAGHIHLNSGADAAVLTYYVYFMDVAGTTTPTVSNTNPAIDPTVDEYFLAGIFRFRVDTGTVTYFKTRYLNTEGVYETVHNLKEDTVFFPPAYLSGLSPTLAAGGKISTASGYIRYPGNEPDTIGSITDGSIMLNGEGKSTTVLAGLDEIGTYADGSAITATKYFKVLVGINRNREGKNAKYMVMRQAKPGTEYVSNAEAIADSEKMAATSFGIEYQDSVIPVCYVSSQMGAGATSDYTKGTTTDVRTGITGTASGVTVVSHSALSNLNVVADHPGYLTLDGTRSLTGNWNAGAKTITSTKAITGETLVSTIAVGTAPITTTSTTMCTNVNADRVDGVEGADILVRGGTVPLTADWDVGSFEVRAQTLYLDKADGTAPMTITSKTVTTNLNADMVDGKHATDVLLVDGTQAMTGALNMGSKAITSCTDVGCATTTATGLSKALTFQSTEAVVAPMVVASAVKVTNLNADLLDGLEAAAFAVAAKGVDNGNTHDHAGGDGAQIAHSGLSGLVAPADDHTQYLLADGTRALSGNWTVGAKNITSTAAISGSTLVATLASGGAAPMTITSTTKVTNLNADMLDGLHDTSFLKADGSVNLAGNMTCTAGVTIDGVDIGDHAANTNAHHNAVTFGANMTANLATLSTQAIELNTQTANHVMAGPTTGAATYPAFRALVAADIDIARTQGTLTLIDGQNDNVALTAGVNEYVVTGPINAFGISGFTGGYGGRHVCILNNTINKNMTAYHQTTSTAANQIWCSGTLANTATNGYGVMEFTYFATLQRWVLTSVIT